MEKSESQIFENDDEADELKSVRRSKMLLILMHVPLFNVFVWLLGIKRLIYLQRD